MSSTETTSKKTTTIYAVFECTGDWDYHEYICGYFFDKEKAEQLKAELESKEKDKRAQEVKCNNCPLFDYYEGESSDDDEVYKKACQTKIDKCNKYCSQLKLVADESEGLSCSNYTCQDDESTFELRSIEVQ